MRRALLLLAFGPALFAQTVLEGDVIDAVSHAPLPGAIVNVNTGEPRPSIAATDASGHFRIALPNSTYFSLQVSRSGFLTYGAAAPLNGQPQTRFSIELTRQAVISGKLEDEDGFPVAHASVQLFSYTPGGPPRRQGMPATSDDRGEYRIANLPAGKYYVRASAPELSDWDQRYWPEFFPGTLEPRETGLIELAAGQERSGVDIDFTKHEGVTVAGSIVMPESAAAPRRLTLNLQSASYQDFHSSTFLRPDAWSFTIPHVPPGKYTLRAQSGNFDPQAGDLYCEQPIEVGGSDLRDIVMSLRVVEPVDLQGFVITDRGATLARPVIIGLRATYGRVKSERTNEDGSFVFKGLLPGKYYVMITPEVSIANPGSITPIYPLSVRFGDKDVMKDGFNLDGSRPPALRITLASAIGKVSGTLLDASGRPVAGGLVWLAPKEGTYQPSSAFTSAKGEFILVAPAGEYAVYAVAVRSQTSSIDSPEYLKAHQSDFPPVRIVEGDKNPPLTLRLPAAR